MNDAELLQEVIHMIERFEGLAEYQRDMQCNLVDAWFTERELKNLIFALKTLKDVTIASDGLQQTDCPWK